MFDHDKFDLRFIVPCQRAFSTHSQISFHDGVVFKRYYVSDGEDVHKQVCILFPNLRKSMDAHKLSACILYY